MLKLLQVCNVGEITGGTAACAWSVARSLPELTHQVAFLGPMRGKTSQWFSEWNPVSWSSLSPKLIEATHCDLVLLHNTSRRSLSNRLRCPTINYLHSKITPAPADRWITCSAWLRTMYGDLDLPVLHQGVPIPPTSDHCRRSNRENDRLIIGRLCTPTARKWPSSLVDVYRQIATQCADVRWAFVGCPPSMRGPLTDACRGQVDFHDADWLARRHLWDWDGMLYHHPTLTESFGRVAGDAYRAGCIPIVDRRGGFIEQLSSGPGFSVRGCRRICGCHPSSVESRRATGEIRSLPCLG